MFVDMFVGHLVADLATQTDFIATNKKQSSLVCLLHCLLYTFVVALFTGFNIPWWGLLAIFIPHFLIDRWYFIPWFMGAIGQASYRDHMGPWSLVIVDNVFHIVTLWGVAKLS